VNAKISYGADYLLQDPDRVHIRPDYLGFLTTDDGEYLQMHGTGIETPTPEAIAIFNDGEDGNGLPFGAYQSG
jgi:hypothetical protein